MQAAAHDTQLSQLKAEMQLAQEEQQQKVTELQVDLLTEVCPGSCASHQSVPSPAYSHPFAEFA